MDEKESAGEQGGRKSASIVVTDRGPAADLAVSDPGSPADKPSTSKK